MTSNRTQTSNLNPGVDFSSTPRIFSVCANNVWEREKSSTVPVPPDWISRHTPCCSAPGPAVKTIAVFESTPIPDRPAKHGFAVTGAGAASLNTTPANQIAAGGEIYSFNAWIRNENPELELTEDNTLLGDCLITVAGMWNRTGHHRIQCSYKAIRPVRNPVKALPSGRIICLTHQLLNL